MRPLIVVALLGTTLSVRPAAGQSSPAQPASGTEESKRAESHASHNDALFENGPIRPNALAEAHRNAALRKPTAGETAPAPPASPAPPAPPPLPTVQAVPPGPPQKNLTGEEFALIRVGSTEKEVLAVLGPPSSQVVVPDDDGHLRESLQYWVKGSPMGTVRLDNGRVVQIETKLK
jgi:hypothetical protein